MHNGTVRLATPTSDDEQEEENVLIDSPKFEYAWWNKKKNKSGI